MTNVMLKVPVALRGKMATSLLKAAEDLGLEPSVVRSQTDGYLVPTEVHQYLFPSQYEDEGETPITNVITDPAEIPVPEDTPDNDPGQDFGDLSNEELDKLTDPNPEK